MAKNKEENPKYVYKYNETIKLGKRVCQEMLGLKLSEEYKDTSTYEYHFSQRSSVLYCEYTIRKTDSLIFTAKCQIDRITGSIYEEDRTVPEGESIYPDVPMILDGNRYGIIDKWLWHKPEDEYKKSSPLILRPLEEIEYIPLKKRDNKIYFFNSYGFLSSSSPASLPSETREKLKNQFLRVTPHANEESFEKFLSVYCSHFRLDEKSLLAEGVYNKHSSLILKMAAAKLEEGDRYEDLIRYVEESKEHYDRLYSEKRGNEAIHARTEGLDRFLARICKPIILRVPENPNPDTFDIIKVDIELLTEWGEDRKAYIEENKKGIIKRAVAKIEKDRGFKRYGVGVNCLAVTEMIMLDRNTLELIFELKKEIRDI